MNTRKLGWQRLLRSAVALALLIMTAASAPAAPFGGKLTDISSLTDTSLTGTPTAWTVGNRKFLAARSTDGHLLVFHRTESSWRAIDLTKKLGRLHSGPPVSWVVGDVEHLAVASRDNRLLVYYRLPGADWALVDVTSKTGRKVQGELEAWQTPDGDMTVEHLAGRTPRVGRLVAFHWSPREDWRAIDVTKRTRTKIAGGVTAFQEVESGRLVEHLIGRTKEGHLVDFHWRPDGRDWQVADLSTSTGRRVSGDVAYWKVGGTHHLAAHDEDGSLLVHWRTGNNKKWRVVDVTAKTGAAIAGRPTPYQRIEGRETLEMLVARGASGSLLQFWWRPSKDWQVVDLTELSGQRARSDVSVLRSPLIDALLQNEDAVFESSDNRLVVLSSYDGARRATDQVQDPDGGPFTRRYGRRPTLAILLDTHRPGHVAPTKASVEAALFGETNSVRDYFLENSRGAFTIEKAGVLGWYDADYPGEHYWEAKDPKDNDHDGFEKNHDRKYMEALRNADREFDFSKYDANHDKMLTPDELAVVIVVAQNGPYGVVRPTLEDGVDSVRAQTVPTSKPLFVDGVKIEQIAEWYTGSPDWPVCAHELGHLLLDHLDMYMGVEMKNAAGDFVDANKKPLFDSNMDGKPDEISFWPHTRAGDYSIMDNSYRRTHLDPLVKLKAGWLQPKVIVSDGTYSLSDVETTGRAWILMDPRRGADEYFIVENRWGPGSDYDGGMRQMGGLAVWHIIQDPDVYTNVPAPRNVDPADWGSDGSWQITGLQMVRPIAEPWIQPINTSLIAQTLNRNALFDGATPGLDHDLLSRDPDSLHTELRWADGTPSGFNIRDISAAGPVMTATIDVPFEPISQAAPQPVISSTIEPRSDRPGQDYKSFWQEKSSPSVCRARCLREDKCAAWTYVKPGVQGTLARCWLKHSAPGVRSNGNTTSGVKFSVEPGIDRPGKDYRSFRLEPDASSDVCRAACVKENRCRAWTYVQPGVQGDTARCWLKDQLPAPKLNTATISGVVGALD